MKVEYSKIDFQSKSSLLFSTSYQKLALTWIKKKKKRKKPRRLLKVEYSILDFHWKSSIAYSTSRLVNYTTYPTYLNYASMVKKNLNGTRVYQTRVPINFTLTSIVLNINSLIHFSPPNSLNSHFSQLSPRPKLSLSHTLIILQIKKLFFFFNLLVNVQTFFFFFWVRPG